MSGDTEFGKCELCGKDSYLVRTYFHYNIDCICHSPNHFDIIRHCNECRPTKPAYTNMLIKGELGEYNIKMDTKHLILI